MNAATARKLMRHEIRAGIVLALLDHDEKGRSPNELVAELGETLGTVAYHVRTLADAKAIRLKSTRPVRGAIEHFYVLTPAGQELSYAASMVVRALDRAGEVAG